MLIVTMDDVVAPCDHAWIMNFPKRVSVVKRLKILLLRRH
jgi:hypothetical protein